MDVVLAGASGLIGSALKNALREDGHQLRVLVRRTPAESDEVHWDPGAAPLAADVLDGADAIVNLSGAGIGDKRWTADYKKTLLASRIRPTSTLVAALAEAGESGPKVLLSASAVGYYGDTGDTEVDETAPVGAGFLSDLCRQWEAAAEPASQHARVVRLRTGLVLSREGGLLGRLRPLVKAGIGGKLGTGKQYQPWITLVDHIAALRFLLTHDVTGPVNVVGPAPARQSDFVHEMGEILHRPTIFPTPAFGIRAVLGGFAGEGVLVGQRAIPAALQSAGFTFTHPDLHSALAWALD